MSSSAVYTGTPADADADAAADVERVKAEMVDAAAQAQAAGSRLDADDRVPYVTTETYGTRVTLPSGRSVQLGGDASASSLERISDFINLTGAPLTLATDAGRVTIAPARRPLALRYSSEQPRLASMPLVVEHAALAEPDNADTVAASARQAIEPARDAETGEPVVRLRKSISAMNVFRAPVAVDFVRPLPRLALDGSCRGVFVTAEVAAAVRALGTPYPMLAEESEESEDFSAATGMPVDDDEEEYKSGAVGERQRAADDAAQPLRGAGKRSRERKFIAMYAGNVADVEPVTTPPVFRSIVHLGRVL